MLQVPFFRGTWSLPLQPKHWIGSNQEWDMAGYVIYPSSPHQESSYGGLAATERSLDS